MREWHLAREEVKAALRELPLEKLGEPIVYAWGPTGSVEKMIGVFVWHEGEEHAEEYVRGARLTTPLNSIIADLLTLCARFVNVCLILIRWCCA